MVVVALLPILAHGLGIALGAIAASAGTAATAAAEAGNFAAQGVAQASQETFKDTAGWVGPIGSSKSSTLQKRCQ